MLLNNVLRWKGFPIDQARQKVDELSSLGAEDILIRQEKEKWEIFRHHQKFTSWYSEKVKFTPTDWAQIPVLQKKDYQAALPSLLSAGTTPDKVYIGNTSGSSGHPFFYAKDKYCHALTWANIQHLYQLHHISLNDLQARFYGIPLDRIGYTKEKIKDKFANRVRFPVFDLSRPVMEKWVERFKKKRFGYLYGYTSSLVHFARYCNATAIVLKELCPSLKACIVTSEICTEEDKKILNSAFGVPVINEYGASEADIIAFTYPNGDWRVSAGNLLVEVVDDHDIPVKEGEEGRILVTSLHNKAMPFIRYEIGDLGVLGFDEEGFPILRKLIGRVNDMIQLPSGKESAGLTFYYISRSILEKSGILREFIIRQISIDTFVFEVVTDRDLNQAEENEIKRQMDIYLEPGLKLIVTRVPNIERKGSGKIKHFYSEISSSI